MRASDGCPGLPALHDFVHGRSKDRRAALAAHIHGCEGCTAIVAAGLRALESSWRAPASWRPSSRPLPYVAAAAALLALAVVLGIVPRARNSRPSPESQSTVAASQLMLFLSGQEARDTPLIRHVDEPWRPCDQRRGPRRSPDVLALIAAADLESEAAGDAFSLDAAHADIVALMSARDEVRLREWTARLATRRDEPRAAFLSGLVAFATQDFEGGLAAFRSAAREPSLSAVSAFNAGHCLRMLHRDVEARETFESAVSLWTGDPAWEAEIRREIEASR